MNIMLQHPPSRAAPYPHVESQTNQIVLHGLSNKQMGIKLQGEGSNPGPPAKPSSDTMINIIFNIDEQTKNSYEQMNEL